MKRLEKRVALITGAGRGIGRAIAKALSEEGAYVAINSLHEETANQVADQLGGIAVPADVTDGRAVKDMFAKVIDRYGRLDILVANAGVMSVNSVVNTSEEEWDRIFAVNTKGVFLCSRSAAQIMSEQGSGRIIAIGSDASKTGYAYLAHYTASKFAVLGFVQSLALELAPYHVNVNCVCPINVETEMMELFAREWARITEKTLEEVLESFNKEVPWGRVARPEDVAKAVVFLATDDSEFITGQGINVSGGLERH